MAMGKCAKTWMLGAFAAMGMCAGTAQADTVLSFIVDGDTFSQPFKITNSSTAGELVTRFQLNLAPTGKFFDTVNGTPGIDNGAPFLSVGGSNITTGLTSPASVADGATLLDLHFNDFNPLESYTWTIDIDGGDSGNNATVLGNQLIGAIATVDFSNGVELIGVLSAVPGNSDASAFTVTQVTVTPSAAPLPGIATAGVALFGVAGLRRRSRAKA